MELSKDFDSKKIEEQVRNYLSDLDLQKMIFESAEKNQEIMFIEGPPTMNGIPHAGHLRGRVIKDLCFVYFLDSLWQFDNCINRLLHLLKSVQGGVKVTY